MVWLRYCLCELFCYTVSQFSVGAFQNDNMMQNTRYKSAFIFKNDSLMGNLVLQGFFFFFHFKRSIWAFSSMYLSSTTDGNIFCPLDNEEWVFLKVSSELGILWFLPSTRSENWHLREPSSTEYYENLEPGNLVNED